MPYVLGIDIGGTTTSAAVSRLSSAGWAAPEVVRLGVRSAAVPSVLHVSGDGALTVGDPDQLDAGRVARGFIRRVGDDVPLIVGGEPCTPQALVAVLAMWVVERVLAHEGEPAEQVVISHPASWGAYRRELLHQALWDIGLATVTLLPEPVAAAESHAARGWGGGTLGVFSLGGTEFEASVVRWADPVGFRLLGSASAVEPFGGADIDEALVGHVRSRLDKQMRHLYASAPHARAALFGLRRECQRVKEDLTAALETDVILTASHGQVRVPVNRADLEELIRPALRVSVDTLVRVVRTCGLRPSELDGVLLVGGAARMPLVAELVRAALPGPVSVEPEPQTTAAAGAALAAVQIVAPPAVRSHGPVWTSQATWTSQLPVVASPNPEPAPHVEQDDTGAGPPPRPPVKITPLKLPRMRSAQRLFGLVGGHP
ncbi:Hsp70 family protein [Phytohabitans rumicis]|uniref:Molecular chaperone DnaK n=1 Tax=Phytohabitans rumicis TaxID=1076125 RepID=A0A6V8LFS6_9ACTN|nr:Hsp70 family protein [Phytohabitans rumicis]GFJ91485.1 molecular chaperone DnaK [Phytohabitans rumicis]